MYTCHGLCTRTRVLVVVLEVGIRWSRYELSELLGTFLHNLNNTLVVGQPARDTDYKTNVTDMSRTIRHVSWTIYILSMTIRLVP